MTTDKIERIRQRAYALWEEEGRPDGRHELHWFQAEGEDEQSPAAGTQNGADGASSRGSLQGSSGTTMQDGAGGQKTIRPAASTTPSQSGRSARTTQR